MIRSEVYGKCGLKIGLTEMEEMSVDIVNRILKPTVKSKSILRGDLFDEYFKHCVDNGVSGNMLGKKQLFNLCRKLGFPERRIGNDYYFNPPLIFGNTIRVETVQDTNTIEYHEKIILDVYEKIKMINSKSKKGDAISVVEDCKKIIEKWSEEL